MQHGDDFRQKFEHLVFVHLVSCNWLYVTSCQTRKTVCCVQDGHPRVMKFYLVWKSRGKVAKPFSLYLLFIFIILEWTLSTSGPNQVIFPFSIVHVFHAVLLTLPFTFGESISHFSSCGNIFPKMINFLINLLISQKKISLIVLEVYSEWRRCWQRLFPSHDVMDVFCMLLFSGYTETLYPILVRSVYR